MLDLRVSWRVFADRFVTIEGTRKMTEMQTNLPPKLQQIVENSQVGEVLKVKIRRGDQTQQVAIRTAEFRNAA
jgi:hypothetical protein